jgi:hypothetical protein
MRIDTWWTANRLGDDLRVAHDPRRGWRNWAGFAARSDSEEHRGVLLDVLDPLRRFASLGDQVVASRVLDEPYLDGPRQTGDAPCRRQVEKAIARAGVVVGHASEG